MKLSKTVPHIALLLKAASHDCGFGRGSELTFRSLSTSAQSRVLAAKTSAMAASCPFDVRVPIAQLVWSSGRKVVKHQTFNPLQHLHLGSPNAQKAVTHVPSSHTGTVRAKVRTCGWNTHVMCLHRSHQIISNKFKDPRQCVEARAVRALQKHRHKLTC